MKVRQALGIYAIIVLAIASGWIINIVKLTRCDFESPYKAEVIRCVGIFPPAGAIIGWIDINDGKPVDNANK